jgi:hypothetical protein
MAIKDVSQAKKCELDSRNNHAISGIIRDSPIAKVAWGDVLVDLAIRVFPRKSESMVVIHMDLKGHDERQKCGQTLVIGPRKCRKAFGFEVCVGSS